MLPSRHPHVLALSLILAALAATGCGGDGDGGSGDRTASATPTPAPTQAAPTPEPQVEGCAAEGDGVRRVEVRDRRARRAATVVGDGPFGLVTVNGIGGDGCQWTELALQLRERGHRVLMFEGGDGDEARHALAGAAWLRRHGARRVGILGTSLGGATATAVASRPRAGFVVLVTLSAVLDPPSPAGDALAAARRLRVPTLHIGSREDGATYFGRDTRTLDRATASPVKQKLLVAGGEHGVDILAGAHGPAVLRQILRFLRAARSPAA